MKSGFLLASSPEQTGFFDLCGAVMERVQAKDDVYLYLIDDGVQSLDQSQIHELRRKGIKLFACAYAAQKRKMMLDPQKAVWSGLAVLADIMIHCDHFLAYTPFSGFQKNDAQKKIQNSVPRLLITIREDPRQSHRPAEAIRMAAGLRSEDRLDVDILLYGAASYLLSSGADEWMDSENHPYFFPLLYGEKKTIYLAPDIQTFSETSKVPFQCDDLDQVQSLIQNANFLIPF